MRIPSMKSLKEAFPTKALEIHNLVTKVTKTTDYKSVNEWVAQCHHTPSYNERLMCALNEIIEGSGTEAIFGKDDPMWPDAEYVNMGDTYTTTLIYDRTKDKMIVGSWGDWVEAQQKKGVNYA